jgi:hypothetical protein
LKNLKEMSLTNIKQDSSNSKKLNSWRLKELRLQGREGLKKPREGIYSKELANIKRHSQKRRSMLESWPKNSSKDSKLIHIVS